MGGISITFIIIVAVFVFLTRGLSMFLRHRARRARGMGGYQDWNGDQTNFGPPGPGNHHGQHGQHGGRGGGWGGGHHGGGWGGHHGGGGGDGGGHHGGGGGHHG
jgi:hypothetical protein